MWLKSRMFLLTAVMFAILYGVIVGIGAWAGIGNAVSYLVLALGFLGLQYLISPSLVGWIMKVRWVSAEEEPELHRMVEELAREAGLPKPKVGISQLSIPNAFAFGRTQHDGRVCVTHGILSLLNKDELRAVLGHEISHIKHRDMAVINLLSAIPLILYWVAWSTMFGGFGYDRRGNGGYAAILGLGAFLLYFITNLLVLYGSRIREYYADIGSVKIGNRPYLLATALYKLSYSSAKNRSREELKRVEGVKAFFVNDPSLSWNEVREISQIDRNRNGVIDAEDLMTLRGMKIHLGFGERFAELFTTHPNMVKRIKHLSTLSV